MATRVELTGIPGAGFSKGDGMLRASPRRRKARVRGARPATRATITPSVKIILNACSTDISRKMISARSTTMMKPVVGFGVVGTNTETMSRPVRARISPKFSAVRKPMLHAPLRGNSTISTCLNEVPLSVSTVSLKVLAPP